MPPELATAASSAASVVPVTPTDVPTDVPTLEQAGAALKNATSWEAAGFPAVADTPVLAEGAPSVTPAGETPVELAPAGDEAPEFVQNAQGQWHRPDGTFANADEITAIEAQLVADAAAAPPPAASAADAPKSETVEIRTRDGKTREVVIDDPELAQEIRQNMNDGMRRREFTERMQQVEAREASIRDIDALIDTNPEAVILQSLNPEQQVRIATALLAQHFDALVPIIQGYDTNPSARIAAVAETQRAMREQDAQFQTATAARRQASAVRGAVETLIPETVAPETAEAFWRDASNDLQFALQRGDKVDPTTVSTLLAARMKLYGFDAPAGSAPAAASLPRIAAVPSSTATASGVAPANGSAVPANDAARALAETDRVKAAQKRIRLTQTARTNAAAIPPAGAGAAPVRLPPVPEGSTIEEASARLRKIKSWT